MPLHTSIWGQKHQQTYWNILTLLLVNSCPNHHKHLMSHVNVCHRIECQRPRKGDEVIRHNRKKKQDNDVEVEGTTYEAGRF